MKFWQNKFWMRTLLGILALSIVSLVVWKRAYIAPGFYVDVKVSYGCAEGYPIKFTITNNSPVELSNVIISVEAYKPGASTNLMEYQMPLDVDYYIKPGETQTSCWSIPVLANGNASWEYRGSVVRTHIRR